VADYGPFSLLPGLVSIHLPTIPLVFNERAQVHRFSWSMTIP